MQLPKRASDAIVTHLYQPAFAQELDELLLSKGMPITGLKLEDESILQHAHNGGAAVRARLIRVGFVAAGALALLQVLMLISGAPSKDGDEGEEVSGDARGLISDSSRWSKGRGDGPYYDTDLGGRGDKPEQRARLDAEI